MLERPPCRLVDAAFAPATVSVTVAVATIAVVVTVITKCVEIATNRLPKIFGVVTKSHAIDHAVNLSAEIENAINLVRILTIIVTEIVDGVAKISHKIVDLVFLIRSIVATTVEVAIKLTLKIFRAILQVTNDRTHVAIISILAILTITVTAIATVVIVIVPITILSGGDGRQTQNE